MADYRFIAQKMIDRVKREGRGDMLTEETLGFIYSLDGKVGNDYNWRSVVKGEDLVWIDSEKAYVARIDCEVV